jgi:hypothetical protein
MMASINDITVRVENATRKTKRRLFKNNIPGANRNPIDSLGFDGLTIAVKGYALNQTDYDQLIGEVAAGPVELSLRTGWYYIAILGPISSPIIVDDVDYFPFDFTFECEEPFAYSTTLNSVETSITSLDETFGGTNITTTGNAPSEPDFIVTAASTEGVFLSQVNKL